jgi:tetratricopeptide (TPR) repeat protein
MHQLLELKKTARLDPRSICDIVISSSMCHELLGGAAQVIDLTAEGVELARKYDLVLELQAVMLMRGWALTKTGSLQEGIAEIRACKGFIDAVDTRMFMETMSSAYLAEALLAAGQPDEARQYVKSGLDFASSHGHYFFEPELFRIGGQIEAEAGDFVPAQSWFDRAIESARGQGARAHELKATLGLGNLLARAGKKAEGKSAVSAVVDLFTDGFETADLAAARAFLQ